MVKKKRYVFKDIMSSLKNVVVSRDGLAVSKQNWKYQHLKIFRQEQKIQNMATAKETNLQVT